MQTLGGWREELTRTLILEILESVKRFAHSLLSIALAVLWSPAEAETEYEKDIAFALSEIETRAGKFFEAKEIDWEAVSAEFAGEAKSVSTAEEHYVLLWRLLARIKDGHASVGTTGKTSSIRWQDEVPEGGLGMFWTRVGDHLFVKNAFSTGKEAGVMPGMEVVQIDGLEPEEWLQQRIETLRDVWSFSTDQQALFYATHWGMRAPLGSEIRVQLRGGDGREMTAEISTKEIRQVPEGPAFFPTPAGGGNYGGNSDLHWCAVETGEGRQIGYVHIRRCKGNLPEHMDEALADLGHLPGIILDWRGNSGGGFDHDALFGRFLPEGKSSRWGKVYESAGPNPYGGPVVAIIDATVRSAGETGAGIFKEDGRAFLIGESPTAGMSSSKQMIELPSGLFTLRVSVHSNKARFNEGRGIEGVGVIPHEEVVFDPRDLREERDTLIQRAIELLEEGFPEGVVPYRPEDFGWEDDE